MFGNIFANDLIKLVLQAIPIANLADNAAASPNTQLYLSLHTSDPGAAGDQSSNEISYTGYARVPVVRSASGWTVTNNVGSPVNNIDFGEMTGGAGGTATHVVIGTAPSGTGKQLLRGAITPALLVNAGTIPRLKTTSTITFLTS